MSDGIADNSSARFCVSENTVGNELTPANNDSTHVRIRDVIPSVGRMWRYFTLQQWYIYLPVLTNVTVRCKVLYVTRTLK
jgi:hypothetical protein